MKTAEEWDKQFDRENRHGEGAYSLCPADIRAIQSDALQEAARVAMKHIIYPEAKNISDAILSLATKLTK